MKKRILFLQVLFLLLLAPMAVHANDFLEKDKHYSAYAAGADKIHFKIPLYSESEAGYSYFVSTRDGWWNSYVYYSVEGDMSQQHAAICLIKSGDADEDEKDKYTCGTAYVLPATGRGIVEVTNICGGQRAVVPDNASWNGYSVKKNEEPDNGNDNVTWLEFDWYPPEALADKQLSVGVHVNLCRHYSPNDLKYVKEWTLATGLSGGQNVIQAQLFQPYFYAVNEQGLTGYGNAAVPYTVFYDPKQYTTSQKPNEVVLTSERSGNIIVATNDTIQEFYATFEVYRKQKPTPEMSTQKTTAVDILPYHRLYDFSVAEEMDASGTYTGNNVLEWHIKNPNIIDLVDGDYFEVQRATQEDFSDAQQLAVIPMVKHDTANTYRYVDNSRDTWTGNAEVYMRDINYQHFSMEDQNFILYDDEGKAYASLNAKVTTNGLKPSYPVYYRVRRASSAIWGWVENYSLQNSMEKHNYLAPLDSVQADYRLDPEYETNRKVHFNIHIDNAKIPEAILPNRENCELTYKVNWLAPNPEDSVTVTFFPQYTEFLFSAEYRVLDAEKLVLQDWRVVPDGSQKFPRGSNLEIKICQRGGSKLDSRSYVLTGDASVIIKQRDPSVTPATTCQMGKDPYIEQRQDAVTDSLYSRIQAKYMTLVNGRCMWDRTAKLILMRTIEETGYVNELIIPQDSIARQEDGSWIATYTDVMNTACAHVNYAARIDQSGCDLRVYDSVYLQPVAIHGPSLYYDEAATITSFTASQGAAVGQQKRGVTLSWMPSSVAVDEYVLTRLAKNSDQPADTIYRGVDNSFFDETAIPDQHYDYVITALYNCNGKSSSNSATAEGWRSPYGEIGGTILMPDNSGLAGVNVVLQGPDGATVKTITTGADGTFLFDSLLYDIGSSSQFAIVPAHTYAVFSFNYTSAQSASVTLSADHAVASGINFINTSTVRLTGRALYKFSTIPVAGAMFTLNGDTVLRNGAPLQTATDGTFELTLNKNQAYTLHIFKPGHTFEGEGILRVEDGEETFALTKALDGVRFYDLTKVRLVGRVAGGIDQRDLPAAFGLGTNNLGDSLQLVLQLEGDNVAQLVHDPDDLSRDTLKQQVAHEVWTSSPSNPGSPRTLKTVGTTNTLFEKKRIIIHPDPQTGEYAVDLYPVKYKVVQASALGYATLFATGAGNETFDLTNAPLQSYDIVHKDDSVHYNAVYDRIYRSPVQVLLKQLLYGMEQDGYGEQSLGVNSVNPNMKQSLKLYSKQEDGTICYTLGYPLFYYNRRYQFEAQAYEDYYYNNDPTQRLDRVPQRGGKVTVRNGMHNSTNRTVFELNDQGKNRNVWLTVDHIQTQTYGDDALSTVSVALDQEGNTVETDAFRAFVVGDIAQGNELTATEAGVTLLDIIRDPGGNGSSAWIENGTIYSYSYNESYDWKVGVNLAPQWGLNVSSDIGVVSAPSGAGAYYGSTFSNSKQFSFTLPIVHEWSWGYKYSYNFTTSEKISTSTKKNKTGIGSKADVFVGVTKSQLTGKAKSVAIIDDSLYQAKRPAIQAGTLHVHSSGVGADGRTYYLVTGEKVVLGSTISNTFAYSQYYILETVIPQLALQRQNLLMTFPDSTAAQAAADARNEPVYWYIDSTAAVSLQDTLARNSYRIFVPQNSDKVYPDRIAALDNTLIGWLGMIVLNEKEKVIARQSGRQVGTYSVSFGNTLSHTDSYSASANYNEAPQGEMFAGEGEKYASQMGQTLLKSTIDNLGNFFSDSKVFGTTINEAMKKLDSKKDKDNNELELGTVSNSSKFKMKWEPVINYNSSSRDNTDKTHKKSCGFTLVPDDQGDITVSVYRAPKDSLWQSKTETVLDNVEYGDDDEKLFGSYVFFTEAGATYCVHEEEEKTKFYNKGTVINNPTMAIAVPEISIDRYEISNVPADQRAVFHIELKNAGEVQYGFASTGTTFALSLTGDSNPHGAKVYVNGAPLVQGLSYFLLPGQVAKQVLEVERGEVDDYENLALYFNVGDCPKTYVFLNFSVHFMPESSPVEIAAPRQNWVMNTLSPHDSVGYYLPIDVTGFNIHHKNFDHIEFQYKLTKESDEMWVNQCSFYAEDSLYNMATGNKAMIENGKITPFRFYGEKDPMEQEYDLRAVSFCRYGSGFVSKASPVISGVKDTRAPVIFGKPQPANSILGIGDDIKLRFSEPIAGNYLDMDNNFQLRGVTNETGITAGTSIHFDGTVGSYAMTKINRSLTGKSFSLDMLVRPTNPNDEETFFSYAVVEGIDFTFGKTADNRLFAQVGQERVTSKKIESPLLEFTRVIMTFDHQKKTVRFFTATNEVTDPATGALPDETVFNISSPLVFGHGYTGDMLEARIWTKALEPDEIAATNAHYLTGYEQELLAYYRMNEGKGDELSDLANGATLYLSNATWKLQKGISLALNDEQVELASDLLGRSENYDETLMFWFKTTSADAPLFRAAWTKNDSVTKGTLLAVENGKLVLHSADNTFSVNAQMVNDNEWHHFVLALSRTFNTAAIYLDGNLTNTAQANKFVAVSGVMYLGGEGFKGNFDELAVFEQMLPASLIHEYYYASPVGDEMGLMAYLPFEEQKQNANGVLEQVFSVNDRRQFRDKTTHEVVEKVVPLVAESQKSKVESMADKTNFAPVRTNSPLSKLNFGWTFNQEELLVNLNMEDYEINKQTVYITVRDVEDLHGNPMPSPVTWAAFVDRNALHWDNNKQNYFMNYNEELGTADNCYYDMVVNATGRRHQFTIESLPEWLTVTPKAGSIQPMESKELKFCPSTDMPVGVYTDIVYLTDENGLSDPLYVEYTVKAVCPYNEPDDGKFPMNMSICGQVVLRRGDQGTIYDTDPEDKVIAMYRNGCVGMVSVDMNDDLNASLVHLTVYGNETMVGKKITFLLWQASTGKTLALNTASPVLFAHGSVMGCMDDQFVVFTAGGSETQDISLNAGWSWVSSNLKINAPIADITSRQPLSDGALIKNPTNRQFSAYSEQKNAFQGTLKQWDYKQIYMAYLTDANTLYLSGEKLTEQDMQVTLRGSGQWNPLPCLLDKVTPITEAMADYYDYASPGDIIKSRGHFAYFSSDKKWRGDLTSLRPGEGYLMQRKGAGTVTVNFYNRSNTQSPTRSHQHAVINSGVPKELGSNGVQSTQSPTAEGGLFINPNAATNMTMIAKIVNNEQLNNQSSIVNRSIVNVYVGDELAAVAEPMMIDDELLYFLTIQSDRVGELRFEMNGETLTIVNNEQLNNQSSIRGPHNQREVGWLVNRQIVNYEADSHHGSLHAPVVLVPVTSPYKIIEDDRVIIIRDGERYDVTGVKLPE